MEMNNETLRAFRKDFSEAVAGLQDKYGVKITLGGITYEQERFTTKMTVTNGRDNEEAERAAFDADVWKFEHLGLTKGMYKRVFIGRDGNRYAIAGFNTKAPKYPLIVIRISDGARVRVSERYIKEFVNEYFAQILPGDME